MDELKKIFAFSVSFAAAFSAGVMLSDMNNIKKEEYTIRNQRIEKPVRFVFLSDLHNREFGDGNDYLVAKVDEAKPDFVVIGGDFVTAKFVYSIDSLDDVIKRLICKYPVYFAIGNHESRLKWEHKTGKLNYDSLLNHLKSMGVKVLDNDSAYLKEYNISLYGLTLPKAFFSKKNEFELSRHCVESLINISKDDSYKILLAHSPEFFDMYKRLGVNLVLSGHMHGGIMRLPGGKGLIGPRFKLFPDDCWGTRKENATRLIVSRGLAMHTVPIRFLNPSEITVITLKGRKKTSALIKDLSRKFIDLLPKK